MVRLKSLAQLVDLLYQEGTAGGTAFDPDNPLDASTPGSTIFNLVAYCFEHLKPFVISEAGFIGGYFSGAEDDLNLVVPHTARPKPTSSHPKPQIPPKNGAGYKKGNNPNATLLNKITLAASECLDRNGDLDALELARALKPFTTAELQDFGRGSKAARLNSVTPYWALIRGFDQAIYRNHIDFGIRSVAPLNHYGREFVCVYPSIVEFPLTRWLDENHFRRTPSMTFNTQLKSIMFYDPLERKAHQDLPQIERITPFFTQKRWDMTKDPLIIGFGLFAGKDLFGIDDPTKLIDFHREEERLFRTCYSERYLGFFDRLVKDPLKEAIKAGCHIVIFPELVMAPTFLQELSNYLGNLSSSKKGNLRLIVAGSTAVEDGEENNVCHLIDAHGCIFGHYFKNTPFVKFKNATDAEAAASAGACAGGSFVAGHQSLSDLELSEKLETPGKEVTIVDIEDIGRVLPSICKDLVPVEPHYTERLADAFLPNIICAPALSPSISGGFDESLGHAARWNHTIACLCDLCAARSFAQGAVEVSRAVVPSVELTVGSPAARPSRFYSAKTVNIMRGCQRCSLLAPGEDSPEAVACMRILEIDYTTPPATGRTCPTLRVSPCPLA